MTEGRRQGAFLQPLRPVIAALVGLALGVGFTAFAGENPLTVLAVIFKGAFGGKYELGMTLAYTTPLILTGLAVALPFHAGLFNIGAEGQLIIGALAATVVGINVSGLPAPVSVALAAVAAFGAGALWGAIPGWLKARRGGHEVISTIMMNFIAAGIASWVVLYLVPSADSQNPESLRLAPEFLLTPWRVFDGAPTGSALPMAIALSLVLVVFLGRSARGFEIKAAGANPEAAKTAGIDVARTQILAMSLAGGLAGLVAVPEILDGAGRFRLGFSSDYGFVGIPVALMARCHPVGVLFGALLFGALQKGTADLDLETTFVTRDLALVIQAMVVLAVAAESSFTLWRKRRPKA